MRPHHPRARKQSVLERGSVAGRTLCAAGLERQITKNSSERPADIRKDAGPNPKPRSEPLGPALSLASLAFTAGSLKRSALAAFLAASSLALGSSKRSFLAFFFASSASGSGRPKRSARFFFFFLSCCFLSFGATYNGMPKRAARAAFFFSSSLSSSVATGAGSRCGLFGCRRRGRRRAGLG